MILISSRQDGHVDDIRMLKMSQGEDIETSFQAAIDTGKINGAVICATDAAGGFVYNKALGERTLLSGEKRPQRLDDVLCLASATKLITTIAALQCVDDGLLSLHDDLSTLAPELAAKQVLAGFPENSETPILESQVRPITLEMLLTHSAGISHDFLDPLIRRCKTVKGLSDVPLSYQPGAGWMYGPGLDWVGRVIERVTGMTLGERIQQHIFDPLGITDAQFQPVTREDLRARMVDLNPDDPDGLGRAVLGSKVNLHKNSQGDSGSHGLVMTGADYVKILHSLLANNGQLLSCATVDDMFRHHLNPEATAAHQAALNGPHGNNFRMGVDHSKTKMGHGLGGLLTLQDVRGWYGKHTLTWGGGFTLAWFIDRENDLCGVGAVQAALPLDRAVVDALKQIFRHDIYRKKAVWKSRQISGK